MNSCKLLPCGRIIFYNSRTVLPPDRYKLNEPASDEGGFSCSEDASYLGLSHALISDNPSNFCWVHPVETPKRARRGTKGITSHGRALIRAGCNWLEERFGKRNLTFLTATLPDEAMMLCTPETWAEVTNRFLKSLRYHLKNQGLCPEIVGCTEIQEKRLRKTNGRPPLHLHLLFQGKQAYQHWAIDKLEYHRLWRQACKSVWQLESEFGEACRVEAIHTSGCAYMAKYLSKGGEVLNQVIPELLPYAWFTVSANLKGIIKATTLRIGNYLAKTLFETIQESQILKWSREIYSSAHGDGSQYLVAWVGQIADRATYWRLKKELDFCISVNTERQNKEYSFTF